MNSTPTSQRPTIAIAGACNSGKSSLLNAICGQSVAITSDTVGTTTDPVRKSIEIADVGACKIIDTPGLNDTSELGEQRVAIARKELIQADLILLVVNSGEISEARTIADELKRLNVSMLGVMTKADLCSNPAEEARLLSKFIGLEIITVDSTTNYGIDLLRKRISAILKDEPENLLGNLIQAGQTALLVMPQDPQAPKGRLILPQSLTIRELLARGCQAICCVPSQLSATLNSLKEYPDIVITDSQVFKEVNDILPSEVPLTSFSVLMAGYKGDLKVFLKGADAVNSLNEQSKVLIAEACTHAPQTEDIGRVKLPRLLRRVIGQNLKIDIVGGADYPDDLSEYDLVIHCGGCMFTRRHVMSRVSKAINSGVPVTNYGIILAHLNGILNRLAIPSE